MSKKLLILLFSAVFSTFPFVKTCFSGNPLNEEASSEGNGTLGEGMTSGSSLVLANSLLDSLIRADKDERKERTATKYLALDKSETELKEFKKASEEQGYRLTQTDREIQKTLVYLDMDIRLLSLAKYHWLILDYGPLREYALTPWDFGHLSYHSALRDTMGGFSKGERVFNNVFTAVQIGNDVLNAAPYLADRFNSLSGAVQSYFGSSSSNSK